MDDAGPRKVKLDALNVDRLPAIDGRRTGYWDTVVPGLVLRVSPTGNRSWAVSFRMPRQAGPGPLYTIAKLPHMGLAAARKEAKRIKAGAALGVDPRGPRRAATAAAGRRRNTVGALCWLYLEADDVELSPGTRKEWTRLLEVEIEPKQIATRPAPELTAAEIRPWGKAIANRSGSVARAADGFLRRVYSWAIGEGLVVGSPFAGVKPPAKAATSDRVLDAEELQALLVGMERIQGQYPDGVQLLLLTMARRAAVLGGRRPELAGLEAASPRWIVPPERAKRARRRTGAKLPHVIPLSPWAVEVIRRRLEAVGPGSAVLFPVARPRRAGQKPASDTSLAFPSRFVRNLKAAAQEALGRTIPPFKLHNIRHTAATLMIEDLGVDEAIVGLLLGHTPRGSADATAIYNRAQLLPQRRAALEAWATFLRKLYDEAPIEMRERLARADKGPTRRARRTRDTAGQQQHAAIQEVGPAA